MPCWSQYKRMPTAPWLTEPSTRCNPLEMICFDLLSDRHTCSGVSSFGGSPGRLEIARKNSSGPVGVVAHRMKARCRIFQSRAMLLSG